MVPPRVHRTRFALLRQGVSAAPDAATGARAPQRTHCAQGHGRSRPLNTDCKGGREKPGKTWSNQTWPPGGKTGGKDRRLGMDTNTLLYLKWTANKVLLCKHRELCSV